MVTTAVSWILLLLGVYVIALNYASIVLNYVNQGRGVPRFRSMIPIIGALCGGLGVYLITNNWWYVLIAVSIDPCTWMVVIGLPWTIIRTCKSGKL